MEDHGDDSSTSVGASESSRAQRNAGSHAPSSSGDILVGTSVEVKGLVSRPELNRQVGTILSYSGTTGRFGVQLSGQHQPVALKFQNLVLLTGRNLDQRTWVDSAIHTGHGLPAMGAAFLEVHPFPSKEKVEAWLRTDAAQRKLASLPKGREQSFPFDHALLKKYYDRVFGGIRSGLCAEEEHYAAVTAIESQLKRQGGISMLVTHQCIWEGLAKYSDLLAPEIRLKFLCNKLYDEEDSEDEVLKAQHQMWVQGRSFPTKEVVQRWLEYIADAKFCKGIYHTFTFTSAAQRSYDHSAVAHLWKLGMWDRAGSREVGWRLHRAGGLEAMQANWYVLNAICNMDIAAFFGMQEPYAPEGVALIPSYVASVWNDIGAWAS